jgi:hypothetical protein
MTGLPFITNQEKNPDDDPSLAIPLDASHDHSPRGSRQRRLEVASALTSKAPTGGRSLDCRLSPFRVMRWACAA